MSYPVENALFQWEDGERRLAEQEGAELHTQVERLVEELRRRLGSSFRVEELADLYAEGPELGSAPAWLADAAYARYAREASDFAGGRRVGDAERLTRSRPQ